MSSFNDKDKAKDLVVRIEELNKSINFYNEKLVDITQDSSFPTEALAQEALSLNRQSLNDLISLQELLDTADLLNKQDSESCAEKIRVQQASIQEAKLDIERASVTYKKSKASYYTSCVVLVSMLVASLLFLNFFDYELGDNLIPAFLTIATIIVGFASNYFSLREAKRTCRLAAEFYELHNSRLEALEDLMKSIDEQNACLDNIKSQTTHTLKCYQRVQNAVMDLYEVRFNG